MILEAFGLQCLSWFVLCHLYFPCPCLRLSLMPAWVYWRASCVVRGQWFWQWCGGRLFGLHFFGGSFSGGIWSSCTLFMWFLGGKCYLRKSPSVWDPNILAIRQQTRKGSEMVSDIFETQFYCMVQMLWLFHVFHFWTTAVKKAGVLNLLLCCLTVFCCEWQSFVFVWQSGGWGTTQIVWYKLL